MDNKGNKLLFVTTWDFTESDGVCKKILSQVKAFRQHGYSVDYTYMKNGSTYVNKDGVDTWLGNNHHLSKLYGHRHIAKYTVKAAYDHVYIRSNKSDPWFITLIKNLKRNNRCKIVMEIPTWPEDKEYITGIRSKLVMFVDRRYRGKLKKYIDRMATYYPSDGEIYGVKELDIINGIDVSTIKTITPITIREADDTIHLIAVAMFQPSHGYEKMIKGMYHYYQNGGNRNIIFDMVGDGYSLGLYKELVKEYDLSDKVIFYGKKFGDELEKIYDKADIGVATLNFGQILQGSKSSELKSREYAAKGLPMICTNEIDVFPSDEFDFVCIVDENKDYIDMEEVIAFHDRIYMNEPRSNVINRIRQAAEDRCDMYAAIKPIVDFYNE